MAQSTCSKCGHHVFELRETEPMGSKYKFYFVQCALCGTVVGVVEYYHVGTRLKRIENLLTPIMQRLGIR